MRDREASGISLQEFRTDIQMSLLQSSTYTDKDTTGRTLKYS